MILIAYSGFLRYDELRNLKCCNVKFFEEHISLKIESSKTDQYRSGNEVLIAKGKVRHVHITCYKNMLL